MQSQTLWMLMAEYHGPTAPLADCLKHLGYGTIGEANRAALDEKLPVPTFRPRNSQRAARMVHLTDLAQHIDNEREKALASWRAANGIEEPVVQEEKSTRRGSRTS